MLTYTLQITPFLSHFVQAEIATKNIFKSKSQPKHLWQEMHVIRTSTKLQTPPLRNKKGSVNDDGFYTDNSCTSHGYKHGCIKSMLNFYTLCDLYSPCFSSQVMVKSIRRVRGFFVMLIEVHMHLIDHFTVLCLVP